MAKLNPCRRVTVGTRKVVTPSGAELEREFKAGFARFMAKRGMHLETRDEVRARFMGRSTV